MADILVIDDDEDLRNTIITLIESVGHTPHGAADGAEGLAILGATKIDIAITDIVMPEKEGISTIIDIKRDFPNIGIIAITGYQDSYLTYAQQLGADLAIRKPLDLPVLMEHIEDLIAKKSSSA